jgi:F420-dependent oxidoreductase-like protein
VVVRITPMPNKPSSPTFSLFLPQAGMSYAQIRDRAQTLERLGYDGLWLVDHFWAGGAPDLDFVEGWTALAALAEATQRLRLGLLVTCNSYRHPGLVAKMAATVDQVSGGRAELGMGAGWMESEYRAYGYDFPPIPQRLAQLGEGLEVITRLFGGGRTDFQGDHYRIQDAPFAPVPVQSPLPITIGGAGEKVLLKLVAKYAQRWNCPMNAAPEIPRLREVLADHCAKIGRDPAEIITSEQTVVVLGKDRKEYEAKRELAELLVGGFADLNTVAVAGTPDDVIAGLRAKIQDKGVQDFAILFGDFGMDDTLELFAEKVMPALR